MDTSCTIGVGDGNGKRYVHGDYESIKHLQDKLLRFEKINQEVEIYRNLLISLHTARWTGNTIRFAEIIDKVGAYSYARTNSNGFEEEEEIMRERTLLALK